MDDRQTGAILRTLRIRKRWRQRDLSRRAHVPRDVIIDVEAGRIGRVQVAHLRALAETCGAWLDVRLRTPNDDGLRMLNAEHARLQDVVVARLRALGWEVIPEASFSFFGERGVIDILAWHPEHHALLIVEIKTALVDAGELLSTSDRRLRLAVRIAAERGWNPQTIGAWVAISDTSANRQRLAANATLIRAALPDDGRAVAAWLQKPDRPLRALGFLRKVAHGDRNEDRRLPRRVRRPSLA